MEKIKSFSTWKIVLVVFCVLLIVGGLIWFFVDSDVDGNVNNSTKTVDADGDVSYVNVALYILLGVGVCVVIYFIYYYFFKSSAVVSDPIKIPVEPRRAKEIFLKEFVKDSGIDYHYDDNGDFVISDPRAIEVGDEYVHFSEKTADGYLTFELIVRRGVKRGVHAVTIPIDRGEKYIFGQYRRFVYHQPLQTFDDKEKQFPMSNPIDKKDRYRMALLDKLGEINDVDRDRYLEDMYKSSLDEDNNIDEKEGD